VILIKIQGHTIQGDKQAPRYKHQVTNVTTSSHVVFVPCNLYLACPACGVRPGVICLCP